MAESTDSSLAFFRNRYSIDANTAGRLLEAALSHGGDYAELYFEHRTSGSITFEQQVVKSANKAISQGLGVRVLLGEAVGYAYTEDLDTEPMLRAAETAEEIASAGGKAPPADILHYDSANYCSLAASTVDVPSGNKVALLRRADDAGRAYHPSISRVDITFGDELKHIAIFTSDSRMSGDVQPMVRFYVTCLSEIDDERQTARTGGGGRMGMRYFDTNSPEDIAREAARQTVLLQSAVEAPAGTFPVVLAAGDSGILLHEAIGHGLEADFNRKKTSNYSDRIGQTVASELCSIVDNGTIAENRGSINIDDGGNPPSENVLIEDGVLQAYLQDRISAEALGTKPTGNGRRESFQHYPMPRMTNTYMLGRDSEPDDIIRSVNRGIYCVAFSGGQVNISKGDFVFSVTEGYMIEDGKVAAPIRNVNLIGNGPETLTQVTGVANDFQLSDGRRTCGKDGQSVPVGVGIPTVLVAGMTVGGTQMG